MGNIDELAITLKKAINLTEKKYIQLKKNARKFAEDNFSPDSHLTNLLKLYNKTIKKTEFNYDEKK